MEIYRNGDDCLSVSLEEGKRKMQRKMEGVGKKDRE